MDLPVWVNGEQLWVKGVEKRTTCDDIIKALLGRETDEYYLFEKWKGVERRLRGVSKIWKIWKEWGDEQEEVRLTLRKDGGRESGRRSRRPGRRRRQHQSVEVLLKLILIQGETIQSQLKKLKEKEEEIRGIEEAKHRERSTRLGDNYLLDTYFEKGSDSGMMTEYPSGDTPPEEEPDPGLSTKIELWEKIVKLNKKIEKEEETLVRLFISLREYGESEIIAELMRLRRDSERFAEELAGGRESLAQVEAALAERKSRVQELCSQLEESEEETVRLLQIIHSYTASGLPVVSSEPDRNTLGLLEAIV